MDRSARRKLAALVAVTSLALVAAACSNNDNNSGSSSPSSASGSSPSESVATSAPAELTIELDWVPNPDHVGLYYACLLYTSPSPRD